MIDKILDKYINNERGGGFELYTLDGISKLLEVLGNPHRRLKTVHIAGTNGKGTTSYIIARVLENSGYKTGLFVSPHLLRINERISIDSLDISDEDLLYYIKKTDTAAEESQIKLTYFDILTAAALCYFHDNKADIAVIETGLGGRLDSTNMIIPEVSIITDISVDHSHILGDTLEKITVEKCGIIKNRIPVITTNTDSNIVSVIRESASLQKTELLEMYNSFNAEILNRDSGFTNFRFSFKKCKPFIINLPLFPEHQVKNASASSSALMLLSERGFSGITPEIITDTIRNIIIPGRFQKLSDNPPVYFDPAHNISSLQNLFDCVNALFPGFRIIKVLTMMKDKVTDDIIRLLESEKENIFYYQSGDPRSYIPSVNQFLHISDDKSVIIERIKTEINSRTIILFTGTFRIYSIAMETAELLSAGN